MEVYFNIETKINGSIEMQRLHLPQEFEILREFLALIVNITALCLSVCLFDSSSLSLRLFDSSSLTVCLSASPA